MTAQQNIDLETITLLSGKCDNEADARFIAAARNLLLPLAEENAKLRKVAEAARRRGYYVGAGHDVDCGCCNCEMAKAFAALEAP